MNNQPLQVGFANSGNQPLRVASAPQQNFNPQQTANTGQVQPAGGFNLLNQLLQGLGGQPQQTPQSNDHPFYDARAGQIVHTANGPEFAAGEREMAPNIAAQNYVGPNPYAPHVQGMRQIPVGQRMTQQDISRLSPQVQQLAQIYNNNPMDARVAHLDPAMFGYAPDNTTPQQNLASHPGIFPYHSQQDGHNINSLSFRAGGYGGTAGVDNGQLFGSLNHNGQPTDPLSALRGLLGL